MDPWFAITSVLAVFAAALGLAAAERRALPAVAATAVFITACTGSVLAALFT